MWIANSAFFKFCPTRCFYCSFTANPIGANKKVVTPYLEALSHEIEEIAKYVDERGLNIESVYFGGGTPALAANRIKEIIDAINEHFIITEGIGLELHPDNVTVEILQTLKDAGVTKISIGIQSFCEKFGKILGRKAVDASKMKSALSAVPFETVSMDFIFALPEQTFDDLKSDIDKAFSSGANHVAIYPFIDFTFTESPLSALPKKEKRSLLDAITKYCQS